MVEILSLLRIVHKVNAGNATISGYYINQNRTFALDFKNYVVKANTRIISVTADDMFVGDLDFYLSQLKFDELFGLETTVDFNNLTMRILSNEKLPVQIIQELSFRRQQMLRNTSVDPDFALLYPRNRKILNGLFMDYSVNKSFSDQFTYGQNLNFGAEFLGGDVQGSHVLSKTQIGLNSNTSNIRWRYTIPDNQSLTQISVGELNANGQISQQFYGITLSNDKVLPRRSFDTYRYSGQTDPQSEVEIYRNNQLVDYQVANEFGDYQIDIPLNFGSSDIRIVTITPNGQITEETRRIQIPFTFLPKNELTYFVNAGFYKQNIFQNSDYRKILQSNISYGLSNAFTFKSGIDIMEEDSLQTLWYNQFNLRLFDQYLITADIAPTAYYRMSGSVLYSNGTSLNLSGTEYSGYGLFNRSQFDRNYSANVFLPFYQTKIPFGLRYSLEYFSYSNNTSWRHYAEINLRLGRVNFRTGYRYSLFSLNESSNYSGRLISSATYTISRSYSVPTYLRGTFLRGQIEFDQKSSSIDNAEFQYSKQVMRNARVDVSVGRNFNIGVNSFQIGFVYDFNFARSTSRLRTRGTQATMSHNLRGSVGFDTGSSHFFTDYRQQVGRAGASIRMFVDQNTNGFYDDGEQILDDPAIRLGRISSSKLGSDGVYRFSQLQQYERYYVTINKGAISNPMLVPREKEFSFVADPNQYKNIDIPFYYSGILEGKIVIKDGVNERSLGGLRLYLENVETGEIREMRTFSDGTFYIDEVDPGNYRLYPDPSQLSILDARPDPEHLDIEVRATYEGDFIDGLNMTLIKN
ncbi:MAG TPA: hypothetical protein DCE78_10075 [Bacteroidetes bacterium]|nr:hypothetical protein [Bacteroidota bacterium]